MKRAFLGLASLAFGLVAVLVSCGPKAPDNLSKSPLTQPSSGPTVEPVASVSASAAPSAPAVDFNDPKAFKVSSWTDENAIKALAADCEWDPGDCLSLLSVAARTSVDGIDFVPEGVDSIPGDSRTLPPAACQGLWPLACAQVPGQSCVPDECSQSDYECIPACDNACSSCALKCTAECQSCKSNCKDDACKLTCAKSCGECRQGCLKELDHCATATCSEVAEKCFRDRDDEWTKATCSKVCPKVQDCVEKCPEVENDYTGERYRNECAKKCLSKHGRGCPSRFDAICAGDPNASVNFNVYHLQRHGADP